jgi:hypothetical protein
LPSPVTDKTIADNTDLDKDHIHSMFSSHSKT